MTAFFVVDGAFAGPEVFGVDADCAFEVGVADDFPPGVGGGCGGEQHQGEQARFYGIIIININA